MNERKATYTVNVQPCTLDRTVTFQPAQLEIDALSRNFIHEGELTGSLALFNKGSNSVDIQTTFLSRGLYELGVTVVLDGKQNLAARSISRKQTTRIVRII
jgi:hypothetical protein